MIDMQYNGTLKWDNKYGHRISERIEGSLRNEEFHDKLNRSGNIKIIVEIKSEKS
jgi:hypothetical protein